MKQLSFILIFALLLTACTDVKVSTSEGTVTKAQFEQIKDGMSYKEVVKIIGGEGELLTESGSPGDDLHTVMYQYNGKGSTGANANFMFQANKLVTKAQSGLK
ncbi:DUF3862 domain-containing protein [Cohnella abietis]|uniref:Lipoprotein SmpA/OmlA domain-containing protein n=1 Tax=Cohnella abietis TaxID=2507935 RepID=A0A3T1D2Y0_9BACL|nr:DUF3862 domain-containing protein [Cohnella abietis]BBI32401.1 hypothetical protein KCTCHS21_18000 [Cohnella abietis]